MSNYSLQLFCICVVLILPVSTSVFCTPSNRQNSFFYHKILRGETLFSIARKYKISVAELRGWNQLANRSRIIAGKKLRIKQQPKNIEINYDNKYLEVIDPFPQSSGKNLSRTISKQTIREIRRIKDIFKPVSGQEKKAVVSVQGKYNRFSGGNYQPYINFYCNGSFNVRSPMKGAVARVGYLQGVGAYLVIHNAHNQEILYGGLDKVYKKEGDKVRQGDSVGICQDGALRLLSVVNKRVIHPQNFVNQLRD